MPFIRVAIDVPLPTLFDYRAPQARADDIGRRIRVPFGRKHVIGVIMAVDERSSIESERIKTASDILQDMPPMPADLLDLLRFCSAYYHHPIGEVVASALPTRFRASRAIVQRVRSTVAVTTGGRRALEEGLKRSPAVARLLSRLCISGRFDSAQMEALDGAERRALKRIIEHGWASEAPEIRAQADAGTSANDDPQRPALTEEQVVAVDAITGASTGFRTWLLHGITGSGKTEVYLQAMEHALRNGHQVLFLVPEIGLTPQLEARIRQRFAQWRIVTMHSGLSAGERARNWIEAHRGDAHVVLGTRSAIFAPMPRLGLIVVDEEHDGSYKQIDGMRYSARDLAVWRAHQRGIPVVLGSATPSLETYHAACSGRYEMLTLSYRANDAPLPSVRMVALPSGQGTHGLSGEVVDAIRSRLAGGEQILVFINRRGYAPVLVCAACAWAPSCHRCSARLVLHKPRARMICHHCGHTEAIPVACTSCGNVDMHPLGYGTQRVEAMLASALPQARILRIDRDTTRAKDSWPAMRGTIARGEVDVLVGTQLLSKGHDFPGLGLVCVLNADQSLYSTDFRAAEHLFAQLTQVAGRAGRGRIAGEVLVQTQFPTHPLYQAVKAHDYRGFAQQLLDERQRARFPPFVHQAVLRAEASKLELSLAFLGEAARLAAEMAEGVDVFEPTPATMERLKGQERAQLLVQSGTRAQLHAFLNQWTDRLAQMRAYGARWAIDVDPMTI